ncbi:hypothetical protein PV08_04453 [Exophiala spinifera]|uniref:Protein kinase domain-containing protein n=1 Tax=Exophiala spinifera TaxID=91928 RepID=A0A0D1ZX40_9EURO|nr:uncharacterized protein PV08_04453 [Exophiala spinifera]KIW17262.1 hypothetical protein PV08_04453 [Exophiala spinifera]
MVHLQWGLRRFFRRSSNTLHSHEGETSNTPSSVSGVDYQVVSRSDDTRFLTPDPGNTQTRVRRQSVSRESVRSRASSIQSRRRPSSSVSRRQYVREPGLEQAIAAHGTVRLNASQIRCTLIVANHQGTGASAEGVRHEVARIEQLIVEFEEDAAFDELHDKAVQHLVRRFNRTAETYYLKVGRFRLVREEPRTVAARGILERKEDWTENLGRKVQAFRGQNFQVNFHVDIEWEYSSLHIEQVPGTLYAETIRRALESKIRLNWEDKLYVPRKDLRQIMTEDTIKKLVLDDKSLNDTEARRLNGFKPVDLDALAKDIYTWAVCLLAWCIYSDLQLVCLYHMLKKGLQDKDLPLTIDNCPDEAYTTKFRICATHSGGFAAYTFARNEKHLVDHQVLPDNAVVPILFDQRDPKSKLGEGSFGVVSKVRIDRDHHEFSDREDEYFAFKRFRDVGANVAASVKAESEVLSKLADAPHTNITTHIASWRQKGNCYMLFRCADCNLRTYMTVNPSPEWTKANLLSIIPQMAGLADGLNHIHNLGPANLQPEEVDLPARGAHRRSSQAGFHHDLKPGNILVTMNEDTGQLLFSISDFGSARIGQILSGSERPSQFTRNRHPGDPVYGAPDVLIDGRNSRPYDMWSMGCILLELLSWMVGKEGYDVKTFEQRRFETLANPNGDQDTTFWYEDMSSKIKLKPAVVDQLRMLKTYCEGRGVFEDLVRETGRLLNLQPRKRPEASQLSGAFKGILLQLNQDLKNENFYLSNAPPRVALAAPPTPTEAMGGLSRTHSIDEGGVHALYPESLLPDPRTHRRSTVGSIHPDAGLRRAAGHARHHSDSDALGRPMQLRTDVHTFAQPSSFSDSDQHETAPNTPRISLSDFDDDPERAVELNADEPVPYTPRF